VQHGGYARRLRSNTKWVLAKGKVSAYYIAKSLGRSAGSVKLRARSLGLILYKKAKAKVK